MVFIIFVRWTPKSLWGSNHLPRHLDSYEKILATPLVQGQVWTHRRVDCEGLLPQASLLFGGAKIKNTTSVIVRAAKSRGLLGPFRLWALISFITTGWDLLRGLETYHKHYGWANRRIYPLPLKHTQPSNGLNTRFSVDCFSDLDLRVQVKVNNYGFDLRVFMSWPVSDLPEVSNSFPVDMALLF